MSAMALPVIELAPMIRELSRLAVKDKRYRQNPVGHQVGRYMRELEFAHAPQTTRDSYEQVLAWLALDHADFPGLDRFCAPDGTEYLREFLHRHWADAAPTTKRHRRSVLRAFFGWALEEGIVPFNPALALRRPRGESKPRHAHPREAIQRLIIAQPTLRDQCAIALMARLGLRKNDLRELQIRDIDLTRNLVSLLHGKGGTVAVLPLEYEELIDDLYLHIVGEQRQPVEYLLYPRKDRSRPMDPSSVHRWFKRCLANAGLPDFPMHELRHTASDELHRTTGSIVAAQQLLRHKSPGTTALYLHPTLEDLRVGMRLVDAAWKGDSDGD